MFSIRTPLILFVGAFVAFAAAAPGLASRHPIANAARAPMPYTAREKSHTAYNGQTVSMYAGQALDTIVGRETRGPVLSEVQPLMSALDTDSGKVSAALERVDGPTFLDATTMDELYTLAEKIIALNGQQTGLGSCLTSSLGNSAPIIPGGPIIALPNVN